MGSNPAGCTRYIEKAPGLMAWGFFVDQEKPAPYASAPLPRMGLPVHCRGHRYQPVPPGHAEQPGALSPTGQQHKHNALIPYLLSLGSHCHKPVPRPELHRRSLLFQRRASAGVQPSPGRDREPCYDTGLLGLCRALFATILFIHNWCTWRSIADIELKSPINGSDRPLEPRKTLGEPQLWRRKLNH